MRKKTLLALLLVMTVLLSSCSLIVKDEIKDNASVILEMGDRKITKSEVKAEVQNQLDSTAYLSSMYGQSYDPTDPAAIAQAQNDAIDSLKKDMALTAKAKELGLDELTDEEKAAVQEDAQKAYDEAVDYVKKYMVEGADEMDEEALAKAADEKMAELGVSLDSYVESETKEKIDDKLREYAIKDVAVTDDEIQADYDSKVEADKETYAEKAGSYATAVNNGTTVYYAPAGVRRVKQILTKFKEDDQKVIDDANTALKDAKTAVTTAQAKVDAANETLEAEDADEEAKAQATKDLEEAQKELDEANTQQAEAEKAVEDATAKAFENIDEDTDAILASLAEGADWQTLMDEKNQDPGMEDNEKGYAVAADMTSFDTAFVEAAMALEKPGDYSGKVKGSSYGYYIIRYEGDEPEGPIALDEVKEKISSALLTARQNTVYNETVEKWVEEAGIKVDLDALKD